MSIEDIGAEIASRLAACTVAAGAETDLGTRVYRGRRRIDDAQIPCVVVVEGSSQSLADDDRVGDVLHAMDVALHAYLPCDADNPNVAAHAALRDLKRALWPKLSGNRIDASLGKRARAVRFTTQDIAPRADGAGFVLAVLQVSVEVAEDLSTP